jgi:hypothetical protein
VLDQRTNAISLFSLLETITYSELKAPPGAAQETPLVPAPLSMTVVAAWMREEEDSPDQKFEAEILCFLPGNDQPAATIPFDPFWFERPAHRLIVWELLLPPYLDIKPGLMRLVNRVRRAGETEWAWKQEYVVRMVQGQEEAAAPKPPAPHADTST